MFDGFFYRTFGDLVKRDPAHLFFIQLQRCCQMPGNRFSLAVRVSCEIYFICFLYFFTKLCQYLPLTTDCNILRLIVMLYINTKLTLWQVSYMSV